MNPLLRKYLWLACMFLVACNRVASHDHPAETLAAKAHIGVVEQAPGTTPFIKKLTLYLEKYADLQTVSYTIAPKPGTYSKPVSVSFERSWLDRDGDYNNFYQRLTLPIFGLYANYLNDVAVTLSFRDGSQHTERVGMDTVPYAEAGAIYSRPTIKTARAAASTPGLDFIFVHNGITTPAVIDTDGNLRWVGRGVSTSISSVFNGSGFFVGNPKTPDLYRVNLTGTWIPGRVSDPAIIDLHHDLAPGKAGLLAEVDTLENGVLQIESVLAEITPEGQVLRKWDMGAIFRKYMRAHGDNPANFVRDGVDWFHMNSAIYNPDDDSLLVSSRENFVAKLDYQSGELKWLFGDSTKHWYVDFPSLRALALTLSAGHAPIGQHSLSLTSNGELLLFNNGLGSLNQPLGTAPGQTRNASFPSRYAIDEGARTAAEVWTYANEPALFSDICSSAYETTAGNYLVTYSVADSRSKARVMGVDSAGKVAFDFEYPTEVCATAFIASPINFGRLTLN